MKLCTLSAVALFSHHAVLIHGLAVQANVSWPYEWPNAAFGLPTKQNNIALENVYPLARDDSKCGVDNKALVASPTRNDNVKSVIIDQILGINQMFSFSDPRKPGYHATGLFPPSFKAGIVISAGAPPNPPTGGYQTNNWNIWSTFQTLEKAEKALVTELNAAKGTTIVKFKQVAGVYEGCRENSYLLDLNPNMDRAQRLNYGEILRETFGQDSFLWYDEIRNSGLQCLDTANYQGRNFGLGFGPTFTGGDKTPSLGVLCTYPAPPVPDKFPEACSIVGKTMFSNENNPWPKYDEKVMIAKGC